jgi:hydroxymethylbilane synthase
VTLRLGTRGSALARTQSQWVADRVAATSGEPVELVVISTRGDRDQKSALSRIGGKGLFTAELEAALRERTIDFAVHSLKDLPTADPEGLVLGAIPVREDPRDALIGKPLEALGPGSRVATGSLRRKVQLEARLPGIAIEELRGNVDTRLRKLTERGLDGVVLAMAGLNRLGIARADIVPLSREIMIPAVGQGALAVQCRGGDDRVLACLQPIDDAPTRSAIDAERAFLSVYGGGCNVPAAAHAWWEGSSLAILACAQGPEGLRRFSGEGNDPSALGKAAARALLA